MGRALKLGLHDARASAADREWLTNVYPFYLHDLSEFDEHYYTLNDRGLWESDHLPSWLQDDTDHPLIIRQSGTCRVRVGKSGAFCRRDAGMCPDRTAALDGELLHGDGSVIRATGLRPRQ